MNVVEKHMPIRNKKVKKKQSPWISEFIFDLMKKRDKVKSRAKRNQKDEDWREYRKLRNKVTFEIKKAKKKYFTEKIQESQGRAQSWEILKLLIPKSTDSVNSIYSNTDDIELANRFNSHFASVANSFTFEEDNSDKVLGDFKPCDNMHSI